MLLLMLIVDAVTLHKPMPVRSYQVTCSANWAGVHTEWGHGRVSCVPVGAAVAGVTVCRQLAGATDCVERPKCKCGLRVSVVLHVQCERVHRYRLFPS